MGEILSRVRFSEGKDYAGGKSMLQHLILTGLGSNPEMKAKFLTHNISK
jgi:hypothetical protein